MQTTVPRRSYGHHIIVSVLFLFCIFTIWNTSLIDWDEGVFALQGQWFSSIGSQGKPFNFQTPPFFQFIIAAIFALIGPQWYVLPLLSTIFMCLTLYVVYGISVSFLSKKEAIFAMLLMLSTELVVFFSRSGLSDATFLFLFISAVYFFLKGIDKDRSRDFIIAGIFTTLALYTKYSAAPLLGAFIIIGLLNRKKLTKPWFLISILAPIVLFLPYLILFITLVKPTTISLRHEYLLGFNHIKYLHYYIVYAPIVFILGIICLIFVRFRRCISGLAIIAGTYFLLVGFYHPFMRLALPIIPIAAILASRFIAVTKRYQLLVLAASVVTGLALSFTTIVYSTSVPRDVGDQADRICSENECYHMYAAVPPNVAFYLPGNIMVPEDHQWTTLGKRFPVFMRSKEIMKRSNNQLNEETSLVYVHATINDSIKGKFKNLFDQMSLVWRTEFDDAPLYDKDFYNPLRTGRQAYEIYLVPLDASPMVVQQCWQLGFEPEITVFRR